MAGKPIERAMVAKIEKDGGIDWILAKIADGWTIKAIAEQDLGESRSLLSIWLNKGENKERLAQARSLFAARMAEEALQIADGVEPLNEQIGKAKLQIDTRKWLASKYDPSNFGEQKATAQVNISIGDLHLRALKDLNKEPQATVDVEVKDVSE